MSISLRRIAQACNEAAELLPRQGPITKFAFLNPLQGLEQIHFDKVMEHVGAVYNNKAYLDDYRYREKLRRGRIVESDLLEVLKEELGERADECVAGLTSRIDLRLAMLKHPLHFGHRRELDWVLAETESLKKFRPEVPEESKTEVLEKFKQWAVAQRPPTVCAALSNVLGWPQQKCGQLSDSSFSTAVSESRWEWVYLQTLWNVLRAGVNQAVAAANQVAMDPNAIVENSLLTHPSMPEFVTSTSDSRVDELMIQFTSAFVDQGFAHSSLPGVESGYWKCFNQIFSQPSLLASRWRRQLWRLLHEIDQSNTGPLESIQKSLKELAIRDADAPAFLGAALLSLRGYAGMIWQTETRPDLFRKPSPPGTLMEFLAVRLLLLTLAKKHPAKSSFSTGRPSSVGSSPRKNIDAEQLAFLLFELAQVLGWNPQALLELNVSQWQALVAEMYEFGDHQRRRIFHAAYERRLAKMALRTFQIRTLQPPVRPEQATVQVVCCIDAREESLRRHLEELDATVETFGIAGFFGVAMYYRGVGDADFSAQCPIIMTPKHWVTEEPVYSLEQADRSRARARRFLGTVQRRFQSQSRGSVGGTIVSTLVGPLATIPMLSRILFPRTTAMMNQTARQFIAPPSFTRLHLERSPDCPPAMPRLAADGSIDDQGVGFTLEEMIQLAERALRDIGLTANFAPIVLLLGHGSSCLNNPHESAYHCGACAGNAGGPNARALAMMLNDVRVRRRLLTLGLSIPDETQFIGGLHNTATEEIMFYDLELLPTRKVKQVREASRLLAEAARRNAHERCRRFESADLKITRNEALLHVQNRSEDLAQTRPEYGNGSNALCFVGRRQRIRGLYLDRRSFLMSYDATQDSANATILARILAAVVPVCEGINLLYSFSAMDPGGWGSGTKLPHNITSLVGVMDGAASDLRPGLPWQGVDIHEPVRLLFIIEATTQTLLKLMEENPTLSKIFRNHWSHLATVDPNTSQMYRFSKDRFVPFKPDADESGLEELATAMRSQDWYQDKREHLPFALIQGMEESVSTQATAAESSHVGVKELPEC
ncbi:MAG: DUF2309 family protein [Planctomycetaceae bacterium]|nr:DUF2309 family protein [Planctomycetaceae bacterium]